MDLILSWEALDRYRDPGATAAPVAPSFWEHVIEATLCQATQQRLAQGEEGLGQAEKQPHPETSELAWGVLEEDTGWSDHQHHQQVEGEEERGGAEKESRDKGHWDIIEAKAQRQAQAKQA